MWMVASTRPTIKAKLLHKVEKMIADHNPPTTLDITIVDAMFFFHTLLNLPRTYGELAELILNKLCKMSPRVDLVFDTYCTPSVKDVEHGRRSADDCMYTITGPEQKRPKDWQKALRSAAFKTAFFRFLLDEWTRHADIAVLTNHKVYIGLEEECHCITITDGHVSSQEIPTLVCCHEEADTRIIYHLQNILLPQQTLPTVAVRSSDTDVFILLLYYVSHHHDCIPQIWMDVGLSSNNTRRYINISQLAVHLDKSMVAALPALHAFTGSDYTASFMNKGKIRALDLMMKKKRVH